MNQKEIVGQSVEERAAELKKAGQHPSVQAPEGNIASKPTPKESAPMEKPRLQTGSESPQDIHQPPKNVEYKPSHPENSSIPPNKALNGKEVERLSKEAEEAKKRLRDSSVNQSEAGSWKIPESLRNAATKR